MPTTPVYALPYAAPTDAPDVPYWLQQLAEKVEAELAYARAPHYATLRANATQSIPNATTTGVDYGVNEGSVGLTVNLTSNNVTVVRAGVYVIAAGIGYPSSTTSYRTLSIEAGGVVVAQQTIAAHASAFNALNCTWTGKLAIGAVIRSTTFHEVGAAFSTASAFDRTFLSISRLGDQ